MQKSYIAKSPINFVEFNFRVNAGDILVHELASHRLTVYRAGEIVKTLQQTSLGIAVLVKNSFISEMVAPAPQPTPAQVVGMLKNVPKIKPDLDPFAAAHPSVAGKRNAVRAADDESITLAPAPTSPPQKRRDEKKRPLLKVEIPEPIVGREE